MAATYDVSALSTSTALGRLYLVRLLIADNEIDTGTTVKNPEFDDEEINYFLSAADDGVYPAAIMAAQTAVARYSEDSTTRSIGDLSITNASTAQSWRGVLSSLKAQMIAADGINAISNADLTTSFDPVFTLGLHDNPRTPSDSTTSSS